MPRRRLSLDPRFATPQDTRILRMSEFGALVRQRRRELGMTQRELSSHTGLSMRLIGEVERGKEHVAVDKLLAILDILNMTMVVHVEGK